MATPTKVEFDVQMTCQSCASAVENALKGAEGVHSFSIDLPTEQVVVETTLPSAKVQELLESTGRRAVIKGMGQAHLGAAVSQMSGFGRSAVQGVVRFVQLSEKKVAIEGTIDGLTPGLHGLAVHELGDLSQGCDSCGDHFNPTNSCHGGPGDQERHVGDLGNVLADERGRAEFRMEDERLKVWDIIGRSLVVHSGKDDLGKGKDASSKQDGSAGPGLACGIVARSASLFQNPKKICTCDGVSLWDERDVPLAGPGRRQQCSL
ncbi:copper chaperone for superoxide dismutase-like [Branchiostoma floridae x Branchiostoma japonicum]